MKYDGDAGCENPAKAEHVSAKGGGSNLGKKTWSPEAVKLGYTKIAAGGITNVSHVLQSEGHAGGVQKVKGKHGAKAPVESKPVSGRKQ